MFCGLGIVIVRPNDLLQTACEISQRFPTGNHVERHWKCVSDVDVIHPQSSSRKFPLDVAVALQRRVIYVQSTTVTLYIINSYRIKTTEQTEITAVDHTSHTDYSALSCAAAFNYFLQLYLKPDVRISFSLTNNVKKKKKKKMMMKSESESESKNTVHNIC